MAEQFNSYIARINEISGKDVALTNIDGSNVVLLDPAGFISNNSVNQEDLVVYATLEARIRPKTLIQNKPEQKILEVNFIKESQLDVNVGAPIGKSFLTTDWTNVGGLGSTMGSDLETFGMTSIDMSMNAGFIPTITINFVDVRGATLFEQGACSPYGAFFHQPWPIFDLTVKGYYGYPVKYSLALQSFNTKFNPSNGNYESTAEFIGYSYAFLSDILLGHVLSAPYMQGSEELLKDIYTKYLAYYSERGINKGENTFDPLNSGQDGKPLTLKNYLDKVQKLQSGQDGQDSEVIAQIRGSQELRTLTDSENIENVLGDIKLLIETFKDKWIDAGGIYNEGTQILSWTNSATVNDPNKINELKELHDYHVGGQISPKVIAYNSLVNENTLGDDLLISESIVAPIIKNDTTGIDVDLNKILVDIGVKEEKFKTKVEDLRKNFNKQANELIKKQLGFIPTIRSFFTVLLANTELFLQLLKNASSEAEKYHKKDGVGGNQTLLFNNVSTTPIHEIYYAWPTYMSLKAGRENVETYPGLNPTFRDWPEVKFVEDFIKALKAMNKSGNDPEELVNQYLDYEGRIGYDNYLPINAMESPAGNPKANISYFNNTTPQEIYKNIGERFIIYSNMTALNPYYLDSSIIVKSSRKYFEKTKEGFYPSTFTHLIDMNDSAYNFSTKFSKKTWGLADGYNLFNTLGNNAMFEVMRSAASTDKVKFKTEVYTALGLTEDSNIEYYYYDKDLTLNPKEGTVTLKPDLNDMSLESLINIAPCEDCTGAVEQGITGSIVEVNDIFRTPLTNLRTLKLKDDNIILSKKDYKINDEVKSFSLIELMTLNTGYDPMNARSNQEGMTRIVDLSKSNSSSAYQYDTDDTWWRYNGLRMRKSTPWLVQSTSLGDLSITSLGQYAKISSYSQVNNLISDTLMMAEIYPDFTLNYYSGYEKVFDTKNKPLFGDYSYAYSLDVGELSGVKGNTDWDYTKKYDNPAKLDSGWSTILPSFYFSQVDNCCAYDYSKTYGAFRASDGTWPEMETIKQVHYTPASTDTVYDKETIQENFKNGKNEYQELQVGRYNKQWVNQTNQLIDTPFWRHNFPSDEVDSSSTNSFSYTMFGSSVLTEVQFKSTGNVVELSPDGFYMGTKVDLEKGLGNYVGFSPVVYRSGTNGYSQHNLNTPVLMLTTHNKGQFKIDTNGKAEIDSRKYVKRSNLNRTEAWKGSLAYLFLSNQLHRPWTGMYTASNKNLGPQSILGTGSMTSIIPKHSAYLLGAVLWRMRESGLLISDDPKWNMEPQQSFIDGKYIDPVNVPELPEVLEFKYGGLGSKTSWKFNSKHFGTTGTNASVTPDSISNLNATFLLIIKTKVNPSALQTILINDGKVIKNGKTLTIKTSDPNTNFIYKCGANKKYLKHIGANSNFTNNPSEGSTYTNDILITYLNTTFCKDNGSINSYSKQLESDIENGSYESNNDVRPPLASLLVNFNTYNRNNQTFGVICFPRADEWPTANLGMVYAMDMDDEVFSEYDNVINPFKNQYKIFTPIFGRKGALALRMTNNLPRYLANETFEDKFLKNIDDIALKEAKRLGYDKGSSGYEKIRQKYYEGLDAKNFNIDNINDVLKKQKNFAGKDESYTKLSFIYHDLEVLKLAEDPSKENGRSVRGEYINSNDPLFTIKQQQKDIDNYFNTVNNKQFQPDLNLEGKSPSVQDLRNLPEIEIDNEISNITNKKIIKTEKASTQSVKLLKYKANGYLRGYTPIGPELWFLPTKVKQKFIELFEEFVGDFNNFNDSSDFDFILKTVDPLNFPKPTPSRNGTVNTKLNIDNVPVGLPDELLYSNFVEVKGTGELAPYVKVDAPASQNVAGLAPNGTTYTIQNTWSIVNSTKANSLDDLKYSKDETDLIKIPSGAIFKKKDDMITSTFYYKPPSFSKPYKIKIKFICDTDNFKVYANADGTEAALGTDPYITVDPQKSLITQLKKVFCGYKAGDSSIIPETTKFKGSQPHPSVVKWLDVYTIDTRTKNISQNKALGEGEPFRSNVTLYNKVKADNPDIQTIHKLLFKDGFVYTQATPRIWWGELKVDKTTGKNTTYNKFRIKKSELNEYIDGFIEAITDSKVAEQTIENIKDEILAGGELSDEDNDIRLTTYRSFKSIYDKWISASPVDGELFFNPIGKNKDGDRLLIDHFSFVNRVNADIGDRVILNVMELGNLLTDYTNSIFGVTNDVLDKSNFNFHPLPSYVDLTLGLTNFGAKENKDFKATALANMFLPQPTSSAFDNLVSGPHFLCMYVGGNSQNLDMTQSYQPGCIEEQSLARSGKKEQQGDSFLFSQKGQMTDDYANDPDSKGVVAFKVNFGSQNQSHFISIDLDQSQYKNTQESLLAIERLSQNSGNEGANGFTTKGQSMYDIYLNRSYSCTVEAMGNMMIQPLQYFELENVPMFKGSYLIRDVKHTISPNTVKTSFTGDRIPQAVVPIIEDVVMAFNLTPSDNVSGTINGEFSKGDFTSNDRLIKGCAIISRLSSDLGLTKEQGAAVVGNLIAESGLVPDILQGGKRGLIVDTKNGYGWAQWTSASRKQGLIDTAKALGVDLNTTPATDEINYLWLIEEMKKFSSGKFLETLKTKKTINDATIYVAIVYEGCDACDEIPQQQERIAFANQVVDACTSSASYDTTVYEDNSNKKCPSGTSDAGVGDGFRKGKLIKIRLCKVTHKTGSVIVNAEIADNINRLFKAAENAGLGKIGSSSGFRTMQEQIDCGKNNGCPKNWTSSSQCRTDTAPPGFSNHQMGLAVDFTQNGSTLRKGGTFYNWMVNNAATYGLKNYYREAWHWSVDGK